MATFNPRRFAQPDKLKEISPGRLLEFFQPFQNYLHGRGLTLAAGRNGIDYPRLAGILMSPDNTTPVDMVDALYFIHEMATQEGMNQLLDAAQNKGLELVYEIESTPADIAVQVWLQDRDLLENQHAQGLVTNPRSFIYFSSLVKKHKFVMPTEETIMALEADLDQWFLKHRRGRGSKVFLFDQDDKISLLIRHGLPTKREGSLKEEGEPTSVHYRPEKHDVVIYNQKLNELAINANTKGEREMYVGLIGRHLFGDESYFPGDEKYTLEPLKKDGTASLVCNDVMGMEWIRLRALSIHRGGRHRALDVKKAVDVFADMEEHGESLHMMSCLVEATFEVKFGKVRRTRSVTIRPANHAQYTRDEDGGLIEEWLAKRGFIPRMRHGLEHENLESVLDGVGGDARSVVRFG